MWLTEAYLNRKGQAVYADCNRAHRILTAITDSATFLWAAPRPDLIITQTERPIAPEEFENLARSVRSREITTSPRKGETWEVTGIVNPRKTQTLPDGKKRKIPVPLDKTRAWITRRLPADVSYLNFEVIPPAKGAGGMLHHRVSFGARVTITDQDAITDALAQGIGSARRYGCGLLLGKKAV